MDDPAVPHLDRCVLDGPLAAGKGDEQIPRCGRAPPYGWHRTRRSPAAGGHAIVGNRAGVRQNHLHAADGHAELLCGRLQ